MFSEEYGVVTRVSRAAIEDTDDGERGANATTPLDHTEQNRIAERNIMISSLISCREIILLLSVINRYFVEDC